MKVLAACAVALVLVGCSKDAQPQIDDAKLVAQAIGVPADVQTSTGHASYLLSDPGTDKGEFTFRLKIDCVECAKWEPGEFVVIKKDGSQVKPSGETVGLTAKMGPAESRSGSVRFAAKQSDVERIVLLRGDPPKPIVKWKTITDAPKAPAADKVSFGTPCETPDQKAQTFAGAVAYCSRVDYTDSYRWSDKQGVIPNDAPVVEAPPPPAPPPPPTVDTTTVQTTVLPSFVIVLPPFFR